MSDFIYQPTNYNFPNLTIEAMNLNGEQKGYRLTANEGYVFYDTTENNTEIDPETMDEIPVTYYYTIAIMPLNYNFDNFPYVAVSRDSVDENYIFGGGNNDHEITEEEYEEIQAEIAEGE